MDKIFVCIASFRDYELPITILDLIHKAKHPERLVFSVILQYDEEPETNQHCLDKLINTYPIHIEKYHWTESQGGCWARNKAQQYYNNEKYTLQIDSHIRVIKEWDDILVKNLEKLREVSPKPIISYLSPPYSRSDKYGIDHTFANLNDDMDRLQIPKIEFMTAQYWVQYTGYTNQQKTGYKSVNVPLLYGGFVFADGIWVREVEQDPLHYYTGEEFALAIRSYTNGYDIYTPEHVVSWHRVHAGGPNKKHYNTFSEDESSQRHKTAMEQLRKLIEGEDLGKYGLGTERTLEQYGQFAGLDFKNRKLLSTDDISKTII